MSLLRRKTFWLILFLTLCIFGGLVIYCLFNADPIRYENFDQIKEGMTRAEAEELLGCAPASYRNAPVEFDGDEVGIFIMLRDMEQGINRYEWQGNQGDIYVNCDNDGKVRWKYYLPATPVRLPWWRWIGQKVGLGANRE